MNKRKIIKGYKRLISSRFNVDTSIDKFKNGIIYTLYSDEFNSLKVGFALNDKILEKKLSSKSLILLGNFVKVPLELIQSQIEILEKL